MSRFADLLARETVDLGPCECPGTPHESDWAKIRSDLSAVEVRRAVDLDGKDTAGIAEGLVEFIPEWNLLDDDGEPWAPSAESFVALKVPTLRALIAGLARAVDASSKVPKASSAPSPASSRGSASRTPRRNRAPGT